jgi:hypothetical protein
MKGSSITAGIFIRKWQSFLLRQTAGICARTWRIGEPAALERFNSNLFAGIISNKRAVNIHLQLFVFALVSLQNLAK